MLPGLDMETVALCPRVLVMMGCVVKLLESGVPMLSEAIPGVFGDIGVRLSDACLLIEARAGRMAFDMLPGKPTRDGVWY